MNEKFTAKKQIMLLCILYKYIMTVMRENTENASGCQTGVPYLLHWRHTLVAFLGS